MNENKDKNEKLVCGKPGTSSETARKYEESKDRIHRGEGTEGDRYNVSQWEWDQQDGGDQRR